MDIVALDSDNNFTPGDLDVSGYFAAVKAYQKIYVADGRPYSAVIGDSGYHKIDMTSTILIGSASGSFTVGETLTQATSGAGGTFIETIGAGATAKHLVYRTDTKEFDTTHLVTGASSLKTVTPTGGVFAPPHWLNWVLAEGTFPDGGSNVMCLFEGRIWMNSMWNPNQWLATRQGNPLDTDTLQNDVKTAISSQTSLAGLVGDALIALIPFKDSYLLFGCAGSFWMLRGGSTGGGNISNISYETGIFSPDSSCWDNEGNLYVIGMDGFYKFPNGIATTGSPIENISLKHTPNLFNLLKLNRKTDRVAMGFDPQTNIIEVAISIQDGSWSVAFSYDITNDSIIPDTFASGNIPTSFLYVNSPQGGISGLLVGCQDGYVKKFDKDTKQDDGEVIDSETLFGPITISQLIKANVKIKEIHIILAEDADGLEWELYQANSNELLVSGIKGGTLTPTYSGTFSAGGRQASIIEKIAGESIAILLKNSTIDTSWAVESIKIKFTIAGKVRE